MRIDKRLHLIVPIYDDGGKNIVAYVHSTPLSREAIDQHFMLLAQTFSVMFTKGLGISAGPGHAMRLLRKTAMAQGAWENEDKTPGDGQLLIHEIQRLTNVIIPGESGKGWQQVPLQVAVAQNRLSEDDRDEVENAIVFFIAVSSTLPRSDRRQMIEAAAALWSAQVSSLNSTEFAASLKTSTAGENTGAKSRAPAPSAPAPVPATVGGKPSSVPY